MISQGVKCGIYGANSAEWIMSMQVLGLSSLLYAIQRSQLHLQKRRRYLSNSRHFQMQQSISRDQTQSFELPIKKMMYTYLTFHSHILFLGPLRRYSYGMVLQLVSGVGMSNC
ncbi:hypothetical protein GLYMA_U043801v4 [Glycine max]|nr:hypothetical protein GLYMA_U043801v4 [Glycine max]|eukprot:XP_014628691.1 uncharacterized protein LOC102669802 [Glycine max]